MEISEVGISSPLIVEGLGFLFSTWSTVKSPTRAIIGLHGSCLRNKLHANFKWTETILKPNWLNNSHRQVGKNNFKIYLQISYLLYFFHRSNVSD